MGMKGAGFSHFQLCSLHYVYEAHIFLDSIVMLMLEKLETQVVTVGKLQNHHLKNFLWNQANLWEVHKSIIGLLPSCHKHLHII